MDPNSEAEKGGGVAVILGSAFDGRPPGGLELEEVKVSTRSGEATLHRVAGLPNAWLLFRHGLPHALLPNQIDYRANALALREVGVASLVVTSSVGVMDPGLPLFTPLPVGDLMMIENRLPGGEACTVFDAPSADQGHLVVNDGLFSAPLDADLATLAEENGVELGEPAIFAYVGGPRTKTAAENRWLASIGAQVNSMTVGPEVVLANELEIVTSAIVVGHKYSVPDVENPDEGGIGASLESSRSAMERLVVAVLKAAPRHDFGNHIYRFGSDE